MDEAHFRADVELRTKWVLRGEPAWVDSTSPRLGEKTTYYSAVCLETGEVEIMNVTENCTAATSVRFLQQLRAKQQVPWIVIWDNGPAHHGPEMREYLSKPALQLRLVPPTRSGAGYSPDFNPDEAIWDWAREEVTANTCFGTAAKVREKLNVFFTGLAPDLVGGWPSGRPKSSSAAAGNCKPRRMPLWLQPIRCVAKHTM